MKKVFVLLASCAALIAVAQKKWETIKGNGNIQKENRNISTFSGIESRGIFEVDVVWAATPAVSVEADENLLPHIVTKISGSTLVITSDNYGISSSRKIQVHVAMPTITDIKLTGSGNLTAHGEFSNSGTTKLAIHGSGNIKFGFASINKLDASVSGSGNLELKEGKVDNLNATVSGSGNINAYDVVSNSVKAKTSGSGDVKVNATQSLEAWSTGSGNVYYKGGATNINMHSTGSGKVVKS